MEDNIVDKKKRNRYKYSTGRKVKDWGMEKHAFFGSVYTSAKKYLEVVRGIKNADQGTYFKLTKGWNKEKRAWIAASIAKKQIDASDDKHLRDPAKTYDLVNSMVTLVFDESSVKDRSKKIKGEIVGILDSMIELHKLGSIQMEVKELKVIYDIVNDIVKSNEENNSEERDIITILPK